VTAPPDDLDAGVDVRRIAVVGAGTMGAGIAASAATAGYQVALIDTTAEAVASGVSRVEAALASTVRRGRMAAETATEARERVAGATSLGSAGKADLVIEAVFESLSVKQRVFAELGRVCRRGSVLATNTSTLDVDAIAAVSGREGDVVGMHFFSPAHVMPLVEIVRGRASGPMALATAAAVARHLGKVGVEVGNGFGFVGNRMLYAYGREKELMLLEGATPQQVDGALEAFGMAMGPNAVGDLAGLDVGYQVRREWRNRPDDPRYYRVSDLLAEAGRLGRKSGRGFYRYPAPGTREPDLETVELIRGEAARLGVRQREITDEEIVERCLLALINEGARVLEEGVARSAADVDLIWCLGYGFPRSRGGPMSYADSLGLPTVLERIEALARVHGSLYWTPARLLTRLAGDNGCFRDGPSSPTA
jgi:3-hydroxyacyl-CoA dehydrogenase